MARFKRGKIHVLRGVGAEITAQGGGTSSILITVTEERGGRNYTSQVRIMLTDLNGLRDIILAARDDTRAWRPPAKQQSEVAYVRPGRSSRVRGGS